MHARVCLLTVRMICASGANATDRMYLGPTYRDLLRGDLVGSLLKNSCTGYERPIIL